MNYELVAELLAESDSDILPQGQYQLIEKFIERRFNHRKISPADADHCKALLAIAASNQAALGIEKRSDTFDDAAFHREGDSSISASSLELRIRQMKDTGIIEERKPGRYRFFHQNILDFFIAKGLQDFTAIEPNRSEWREVILFRAGMPDGNRMLDHLEKLKADNFEIDESLMLEARRIIESNSQGQH